MPSHALLVVDMTRDFIAPGGALSCGEPGLAIVPAVLGLAEKTLADGGLVIFANDAHRPNDPEFALWPRHCVAGTPGAELYGELKSFFDARQGDRMRLLPKTKYDAFYATPLDDWLRAEGVRTVAVAGVCTSICCYSTAAGAYFRGYGVVAHPGAMADLSPEAHRFAVDHMQTVLKARIEQPTR